MIQLSDHFTYKKLLGFTFPSVIMLVLTSFYCVADGFFVSNFAGKAPFTAVNFIYPFLMILGSVGFMFGTGGSALIAKIMGEGDPDKADRIFSQLIYVSIAVSTALAVLGMLVIRPVAIFMGASGRLLEDSLIYGRIYLLGLPAYILQYEFQSLFSTAEKPHMGLWMTVAAGVTNIILDALFVAVFSWGIRGAAYATVISQVIGGVIPVLYFAGKNSSRLRLTRAKYDHRAMIRVCTNGISELLSNISMAVVDMLYNIQLLKYAGEDGVAAYGVLMYVNLVFVGVFFGYAVGAAPIISYHYGAENRRELRSILKKSIVIVGISSVFMTVIAEVLAKPLSLIYVSYDPGLLEMTLRGFVLYSFSFLFSGFAIMGSAFFTALNDGVTSALLSFLRIFVFEITAVLLFPLIWKLDGIWISIVAAEALAVLVTVLFVVGKRKKYGY